MPGAGHESSKLSYPHGCGEFFLKGRSHFDFWKMFKLQSLALKQISLSKVYDSEEHGDISVICQACHLLLTLAGFLAPAVFFGSELYHTVMLPEKVSPSICF